MAPHVRPIILLFCKCTCICIWNILKPREGVRDSRGTVNRCIYKSTNKTNKKMSNTGHVNNNWGESKCSRRLSNSCFVYNSCRITGIAKSGIRLISDREKKISVEGNDSLLFEKWIFRNDQPVHDDDILVYECFSYSI